MSLFYELFAGHKKRRCSECDCLLMPDSESDICECCVDDFYDYEEDE